MTIRLMRLITLLKTTIRLPLGLCAVGTDQVKFELRRAGFSGRFRRPLCLVAAMLGLGCLGVGASGCDGAESASVESAMAWLERAGLEEMLQEQLRGGRKTGMLRALQVGRTARRVAVNRNARPNPACRAALPDKGAFRYGFELILERRGPGDSGVAARWRERRTLRRDDFGHLSLTMTADYRQPTGLEGRRALRWLLVDGHAYFSDETVRDVGAETEAEGSVDGPAYYRRKAAFDSRLRLVDAGVGTLQILLDAAARGWRKVPGRQAQWTLGGERLVCTKRAASEATWLRRFGAQAAASTGNLRIVDSVREDFAAGKQARERAMREPSKSRELRIEWLLKDGSTLVADFRDSLSADVAPIRPPPAEDIVAVERDRSLAEAKRLVAEWSARGWVKQLN
jgi:hypothetical protein